ncbi:MAG TPA: methyl-accepting chemotaxis protein [Malonomonas sp.]
MNLKKLFHLNLSKKIILMATAIIVIFCIALIGLYQGVRSNSFAERQLKVQHQTETAWGVLEHYAGLEKSGQLSRDEAQQQAMAAVKKLRYGKSGYFWINDMQPAMVMHPIKPALDGKNLSATEDPSGKKLFVEFVKVSRQHGGGFVNYLWPKPGFDEPVEKISYVKRLAAWDWIVGTGLYVDDMEAALSSIRTTNFSIVLLVIVVTTILTWLVNRSIAKPLRQIRKAIYQLAKGETEIQVDCGKPVDCSKAKGCSEPDCPSYGKEDLCWVNAGSFAADKHCPRAQRGEDCKTCELYGPTNNMQELGSALLGLANAMKARASLARQIADGDLTKEVTVSSEHDELGNALVRMHANLKNILCQILSTASLIASGSAAVENTSQALTDGSTRQAASLEQINSSVAQMSDQTRRNAENANQANNLANKAKGSAENGNQQMDDLVRAMAEINQSGQNISKIIKVIDEIAFQTNLLALNAAVEAARAGQHGKGFAVVAEEVRNLAARSAKAAQETAELIEGSVAKASNGAQLADTTAAALNQIVTGITQATDLMGEIAAASNDQAQSTDQINSGLNQIDQVGQQNTAFAHETASTAEELASQARHLNELLAQFNLGQDGCERLTAGAQPRRQQNRTLSAPTASKRPAAKPTVRPVTKPAPAAKPAAVGSGGGWGNLDKSAGPAPKIALDDDEFGKY